mgnify:CR=1 FL=1
MGNWEYKQVYCKIPEVLSTLNKLGGQGWELCVINWNECGLNENILYLKRPMKCENCGYYKPSEYYAFDSKCEKIGLLHNHNGCEKFKPKN